jgi:2',3'-cyclic-nucleotide 2'-phosphodiesterase (5'-nucleotidase family)
MGGLSRKISYINTLKNNKINPIIVDAGDALFTHPNYSLLRLPSEKYKAKVFLEGYEKIGCDALNIGEYDLAAGYEFLKSLDKNSTIPFISANLRVKETGELAFKPYVIISRNMLKIGIIGVTDYLPKEVNELYKEDYLSTGHKMIDTLRGNVDILVMLVNSSMNQKNTILESFKDADYIYLSRTVSNTRSIVPQKDGYPIFYTIGLNGKYLIEVKTTIKNDKKPVVDVSSFETRLSTIVRQLIRLKTTEGNQTIEEKYAAKPQVLAQIQHYEKQVKELEKNISKIVNTSKIKIVALPKNTKYDAEMQSFIDNVLVEVKNQ